MAINCSIMFGFCRSGHIYHTLVSDIFSFIVFSCDTSDTVDSVDFTGIVETFSLTSSVSDALESDCFCS